MKFVLQANELEGGQSGDILRQEVEWPVLPRIGEMVGIEGNCHEVVSVYHEMDTSDWLILIGVDMDSQDFNLLPKDKWHP